MFYSPFGPSQTIPPLPQSSSDLSLPPPPPTCVGRWRLLQQWDRGSRAKRVRLLGQLLAQYAGVKEPALEQSLGPAAMLLFTRLTAWLRLTYQLGYAPAAPPQLRLSPTSHLVLLAGSLDGVGTFFPEASCCCLFFVFPPPGDKITISKLN